MPGLYAIASDFFGGRAYDNYHHSPYFAIRADWILTRWPDVVGQKALVVGCGPGAFLVEELLDRGVDCYGIDAYAKNAAHGFSIQTRADVATRCIFDADTTNSSDVARISGRDYLNLRGQERIFLTITDDVLTALSAADAATAVGIIAGRSTNAAHILTCNRDPDTPDPERDTTIGYLWLTEGAWRALIDGAGGSTHVCYNSEERREF